jgi:hypothetical protein
LWLYACPKVWSFLADKISEMYQSECAINWCYLQIHQCHKTIQLKDKLIQLKDKPIQLKDKPIQPKDKPIQLKDEETEVNTTKRWGSGSKS